MTHVGIHPDAGVPASIHHGRPGDATNAKTDARRWATDVELADWSVSKVIEAVPEFEEMVEVAKRRMSTATTDHDRARHTGRRLLKEECLQLLRVRIEEARPLDELAG